MRIPTLRRKRTTVEPGVIGEVRIDRRTKSLTKRLRLGDIAIIDHVDLDRTSAEELVAAGVGAVVNISASTSGRYPNLGPRIIAEAGIPLVDQVGENVFLALKEGESVRVDEGRIYHRGGDIGGGAVIDLRRAEQLMVEARAGLTTQLEAFTANTSEFLRHEHDLLLDGVGVPETRTDFEDRHVLVVVTGYDYREDLDLLRPYIREYQPLLVGVDGGADALLEVGLNPDLIIGEMEAVTDEALRSGAELVVHTSRDGRAPGLARLELLGADASVFPGAGTSEDAAMLMANHKGASMIVSVGSHNSLVEFLDKGRSAMSSAFLTRLRIGPKLVDAKGVGEMYRSRIPTWQVLLLILAGLLAVAVAVASTPRGEDWFDALGGRWDDFTYWLQGLFS